MNWKKLLLMMCLVGVEGCTLFSDRSPSRLPHGAVIDIETGPTGIVQQTLLSQLEVWRGTPYVLGGTSKRGIDCSAFVQTTLVERFQTSVPRNTEQQVQAGFDVEQREVVPGDLVFFRTGRNSGHVGLYVGSRWFLHASTSAGVTLNSLDDPYWRSRYWTARRVIF